MKRNYSAPKVEIVTFDFNDQVVVASSVGNMGSSISAEHCQYSSTSCSYFFDTACSHISPTNL